MLSSVQAAYTHVRFGANAKSLTTNFYALHDRLMDGEMVSMEKFKGDALVIVNVASKWGLTEREYTQLGKLADEFGDQGLKILLFPCNQFGGQEPGTSDDIRATAAKFGATSDKIVFFEKADVNGADAREVFSFLKERLPFEDGSTNVMWNFGKFLVDHEGNPRQRFGSKEPAISMKETIQKILEERNNKGR
jgi:glutathione peroxidase